MKFDGIEQQIISFDFDSLQADSENAIANIAVANTADDIKADICKIWSKIGPFVKKAEWIPFIGKFIKILAMLLDAICEK